MTSPAGAAHQGQTWTQHQKENRFLATEATLGAMPIPQ